MPYQALTAGSLGADGQPEGKQFHKDFIPCVSDATEAPGVPRMATQRTANVSKSQTQSWLHLVTQARWKTLPWGASAQHTRFPAHPEHREAPVFSLTLPSVQSQTGTPGNKAYLSRVSV